MQINFYEYAEAIKPVDEFGIFDPDDKNGKFPAKVRYDKNLDKWNATVRCNFRDDYNFIAVDNNIPLKQTGENGIEQDKKRCDAMLYTNKSICFVELKNERTNWLSDAVSQLESTIEDFGNEIDRYQYKQAYVCNMAHPQFHYSYKDKQTKFYQKHKIVLRVSCKIEEIK